MTLMKKLLLFFVAISASLFINAQTPGCAGASDLNQTNDFPYTASSGGIPGIDFGCAIGDSTQFVWFGYFTVCSSGTLDISAIASNSSQDLDIVVWGPFTSTNNICQQLTASNTVACSASAGEDTISMTMVTAGEVYMVSVVADTNPIASWTYFQHSGTAVITGNCPPPPPPCSPVNGPEMLCLVTVDSATQEYQLIWNEVAGNPVTHFGILKWDYLGVPQEIDTVQISSLSTYIDVSANPAVHTERYSIITYDTCASFWGPNGYIEPVFCQSSLSTQGTVNVAWSHYLDSWGNGPVYYVIYRGATPANMVAIDTVANFVNYYTDINPLAGTSYYKIGVALYSACVPMRLQQSAQTNYFVQSFSNAAPITVVGIGENSLQEVSLFPNPSDGNITVKNVNAVSILKVYDLAGRIVLQQQLQANVTQQISLENLESGMYSLVIDNETGLFRQDLVIRR
jgi:hypothetical protein